MIRGFRHLRKEVRPKLDYSDCAIPKIRRVVSPKNMETIRRIGKCEACLVICRPHPHHVSSRGAGGSDTLNNLVGLCFKCHRMAHDGLIPRSQLRAIAAGRASTQT